MADRQGPSDGSVSPGFVAALVPWAAVAASLSAFAQVGVAPPSLAPLLRTPVVYVVTGAVAVGTGALGTAPGDGGWTRAEALAAAGVVVQSAVVGVAAVLGGEALGVVTPVGSVAVAVVATWLVWTALDGVAPRATRGTGLLGLLVVFGHVLDAVTTVVGVDVLGFSERTRLSRQILAAAADLPTADLLGAGWLFVVVKLAVALLVLDVAATDDPDDRPRALLLALVAAAGLGPGAHNVVLYLLY